MLAMESIFATSDTYQPQDFLSHFRSLTPEQQTAERAADNAAMDADHADWLTSGEPDHLEILVQRRKAERAAASAELEAIAATARQRRRAANYNDEPCEAIDAEEDAARAAWHQKYDHLWPAHQMKGARERYNKEQDAYVTAVRTAEAQKSKIDRVECVTMAIVPFPVPQQSTKAQRDYIQNSAEFVRGFVPPEYVLDGVLQRRFCYSITAQTGVGKTTVAMLLSAHVSLGRSLGALDVAKGSVIYFAGENPTDIQMRWLGLTQELRIDPLTADVYFIPGVLPLSQVAAHISAEVARKGLQPALVVVDTAAAYNEGDDENSNAQAAAHARRLRSLTELPGGPCVLILCHPTKRAADDDLSPRGGGAFLAEVDGNIALQKRDTLIVASAQGKFRGSDAWSLRFELKTLRDHPMLKDTRGRGIPTVVARPVDESAATALESSGGQDEDTVLRALPNRTESGVTPTNVARKLRWFIRNDPKQPAHTKVSRVLQSLKSDKLVELARQNRWRLTSKGEQELNKMDLAATTVVPTPP